MDKVEKFYRKKCGFPKSEILVLGDDDHEIIQLLQEYAKRLKNKNTLSPIKGRDLYQELREIGLTHDAVDAVLEWKETLL